MLRKNHGRIVMARRAHPLNPSLKDRSSSAEDTGRPEEGRASCRGGKGRHPAQEMAMPLLPEQPLRSRREQVTATDFVEEDSMVAGKERGGGSSTGAIPGQAMSGGARSPDEAPVHVHDDLVRGRPLFSSVFPRSSFSKIVLLTKMHLAEKRESPTERQEKENGKTST